MRPAQAKVLLLVILIRALAQDYDSSSGGREFTWDVVLHGPIIGMSVTW